MNYYEDFSNPHFHKQPEPYFSNYNHNPYYSRVGGVIYLGVEAGSECDKEFARIRRYNIGDFNMPKRNDTTM